MFNIEKHQRTKASESPLRPVKRAEIRKTDNGKCWQNVEEQKLSCTAGGNTDGYSQFTSELGSFFIVEHWGHLQGGHTPAENFRCRLVPF